MHFKRSVWDINIFIIFLLVFLRSISFSLQKAHFLHVKISSIWLCWGSSLSCGLQTCPDASCLMESSPLLAMDLGWDHSMSFEAQMDRVRCSFLIFPGVFLTLDKEVHGPETISAYQKGLREWVVQATDILPAPLPAGASVRHTYKWKRGPFSAQSQTNTKVTRWFLFSARGTSNRLEQNKNKPKPHF